jgi:hypothetical protein
VIRPVYRYRVNGRSYEGRRIMFGPETRYAKEAEAERALDDYKDPTLTVHYDPRRPQDSVLKVRLDGGEYIFMAVCGLIPLIGGVSSAMEKAGAAH